VCFSSVECRGLEHAASELHVALKDVVLYLSRND